jgi:hypothetical protein
MRPAETILLACAAFLLGGCNLVISETPVFRADDASGAPPLKTGLWASPDPGCAFETADPLDKWPSCANGTMIGPNAIVGTMSTTGITLDQGKSPSGPRKVNLPYVLAAGDPRVMQVDMRVPELGKLGVFYFVAIHPTAFDADGRITAAEAWPVQCGPPHPPQTTPTAANDDLSKGLVTEHPLPGLKIENGECRPADKAAVRNAARPSRSWVDHIGEMHWVRSSEK